MGKAHCRVPKKESGMLVPDTEAIITDFELMGEGLVKSIEILTHHEDQEQ